MGQASEIDSARIPDALGATAKGEDRLSAGRLNHLRALEAESIHILREAAAEFARPVMLYSIGKDPRAGRWPGFQKTECGLYAKE